MSIETNLNFFKYCLNYYHGYTYFLVGSVLLFLFSSASIFLFFVYIPSDYLRIRPKNKPLGFIKAIKNVFGYLLILVGIILLVLPGQGLITILMGLILIDHHHKDVWISKFWKSPIVFSKINAWRKLFSKPPLIPPETEYFETKT